MATRTNTYKTKTKSKRNSTKAESEETQKEERAPVGSYNEDQTIIQMAMDLFEDSQDGSNYNRIEAEEDIRFGRLSEQWPKDIKQSREEQKRPCLTINKIPSFIRQVVNDVKQNKPSIIVSPIDNGADPDTAEVLTGLVRSIERNSNALQTYCNSVDNSASCGFGFMQLSIEYANEYSFDREIKICPVPNPLSVHWDVTDYNLGASEWRYCFLSELLDQKKFEEDWPDAAKVSFEGDINQRESWWLSDDGVRVSDFWLKEFETKKLLMIRDKSNPLAEPAVIKGEDYESNPEAKKMVEAGLWEVVEEREIQSPKVVRRKITGAEVLEKLEWPGPTIPVSPVWGEIVILDGRRYLRSMIRDVKDSQIMFNYWRTTATEMVALQPRAPLFVKSGSIPEGHQHKYETANTKNWAYLEYEGDIPPQRQQMAAVPTGMIQEALNASDDMKAITGIHDASLGAQGNETSGKAIRLRQTKGDLANYHFTDNLNHGIQYLAKCIVDAIPSVYSQRSMIRILGEDMTEKVVNLGKIEGAMQGEKLYDLSVGRYDVTVKAGPSYMSQREETREVFIEMMRSMPQIAPYISDFLMDHMDFQGAQKLSKRLKLLLPPEIQKMEMEEETKDLPPEFRDAMKQAQMVIQELEGKLKEAMNEQAPEMKKLELEEKKAERDAMIDEVRAQAESMKAQSDQARTDADLTLKQEVNTLKARELDIKEKEAEIKELEVRIKEEELALKQEELRIKEVEILHEPAKKEESAEKKEKSDNDNKDATAIQAGLLALVKTQQSPIEVTRGKDGKISGAKRTEKPTPDKIN
jgi:hypothetical protein